MRVHDVFVMAFRLSIFWSLVSQSPEMGTSVMVLVECNSRNAHVENMVEKNRTRFLIAVLLTIMLYNCWTTTYLFFLTYQLTL